MGCIGPDAEGDPGKAWIPDTRRHRDLERDIPLDRSILEVGSRQQREAFVILPFHGDADGLAPQIFHRFRLHPRRNQAGRIAKRKGLHARRRLCKQATGRQYGYCAVIQPTLQHHHANAARTYNAKCRR